MRKLYCICAASFIVVGSLIYLSLTYGKYFTEMFNDIAVGLGTLLAGIGGLVVFLKWTQNSINKFWFQEIRATYPAQKLLKRDEVIAPNKTFILLRFPKRFGRIYIYDLKMKTRYWINNGPTLAELDYEYNSWIDIEDESNLTFKIFDKEWKDYQSYEDGKPVSIIDPYQDK